MFIQFSLPNYSVRGWGGRLGGGGYGMGEYMENIYLKLAAPFPLRAFNRFTGSICGNWWCDCNPYEVRKMGGDKAGRGCGI